MPGKQIVLNPDHLIQSSDDSALHHIINLHYHDSANYNVHYVAKEDTHMNILDSELWTLGTVLESGQASVYNYESKAVAARMCQKKKIGKASRKRTHDPHIVQVDPKW